MWRAFPSLHPSTKVATNVLRRMGTEGQATFAGEQSSRRLRTVVSVVATMEVPKQAARLEVPVAPVREVWEERAGTKRIREPAPSGTKRRRISPRRAGAYAPCELVPCETEVTVVPSILISEPAEEAPAVDEDERGFLTALAELSAEGIEALQQLYITSRACNATESAMTRLYNKRPVQVLRGLFGLVQAVLEPPPGSELQALYSATAKKTVLAVLWLLHPVLLHMAEENGADGRLRTLQVGSERCAGLLRLLGPLAMDMSAFEVVERNGLLAAHVRPDCPEPTLRAWSLRAALLCAALRLVRSTIADWDMAGSAAAVAAMQLLLRLDALYRWHAAAEAREGQWRGKASEFISVQKTMRGANTVFEELFNDRRLYREEVPVHRHDVVLRHIRSLLSDQAALLRMRDSGVRLLRTVSCFYGQQLQFLLEVDQQDLAATRAVAHALAQALEGLQYECDLKEMAAVILLFRRMCALGEQGVAEILLPHVLAYAAGAALDVPCAETLVQALLALPCRLGDVGIDALLSVLRSEPGKAAAAGSHLYGQVVQVLVQQLKARKDAALAELCTSAPLLRELEERLKEPVTAAETLRLLQAFVATNENCIFQLIDCGLACVVLCSKSLAALSRSFAKMHAAFCKGRESLLEWRIMTAPPEAAVFTAMCVRTTLSAPAFEELMKRTGALRRFEAYLVAAQADDQAKDRRGSYCQSVAALLLQDLSQQYAAGYWEAERSHIERAVRAAPPPAACLAKQFETREATGDVLLCVGREEDAVPAHRCLLENNVGLRKLLEHAETAEGRTRVTIEATTPAAVAVLVRHFYGMADAGLTQGSAAAVLDLCFRFDLAAGLRVRCVRFLFDNVDLADLCACYHMARQWGDRTVKLCCLRSAISKLPSILLHRKLHSWPVALRSQLVADCCDLVRALLPPTAD